MKLLVGQKRFAVLARREMSITCRVQIGGRCEIASADRVRLPVHYIETQSFCVAIWWDVKNPADRAMLASRLDSRASTVCTAVEPSPSLLIRIHRTVCLGE